MSELTDYIAINGSDYKAVNIALGTDFLDPINAGSAEYSILIDAMDDQVANAITDGTKPIDECLSFLDELIAQAQWMRRTIRETTYEDELPESAQVEVTIERRIQFIGIVNECQYIQDAISSLMYGVICRNGGPKEEYDVVSAKVI
jgi:hypothetical protein